MARILAVDDDAPSLDLLGKFLRSRGYEVLLTSSPFEAIRLTRQEKPDLVLLDVMMPGMDGWNVARQIRTFSDVPIIFLTVRSSMEDKLRGFQLQADDYITKPFDLRELEQRIQAVLRRTQQPEPELPELLEVPPFRIRTKERVAEFRGAPLRLTPKEYHVLLFLVQHAGEVCDPQEIVNAVWGPDYTPQTADLRKYIWMLRQKVEEDPTRPRYLQTVRGFGYRLVGDADSGKKEEKAIQ